jgi:hypothetical protein
LAIAGFLIDAGAAWRQPGGQSKRVKPSCQHIAAGIRAVLEQSGIYSRFRPVLPADCTHDAEQRRRHSDAYGGLALSFAADYRNQWTSDGAAGQFNPS